MVNRRFFFCLTLIVVLAFLSAGSVVAQAQNEAEKLEDRLRRYYSLSDVELGDSAIRMMIDGDLDAFSAHVQSARGRNRFYYKKVSYLHLAAALDRPEFISHLAALGANIDPVFGSGHMTPLHVAVGLGNRNAVEILVKNKANASRPMATSVRPLLLAVKNADQEMAQILIDGGAEINLFSRGYDSPLTIAAKLGNYEMFSFLIERSESVHTKDGRQRTLIHEAVFEDVPELVGWLVDLGLDVNARDVNGYTPVYDAVRFNRSEILGVLIENGGDVNLASSRGFTPLMLASYRGKRLEVMQELIDAGAYIEASRESGQTALMSAAGYSGVEEIQLLIDNGAYTERFNRYGRTVFHYALNEDKLENFTYLLDLGIDPTIKKPGKFNVLLSACWRGKLSFVMALVDRGFDVNYKSVDNDTALFVATRKDHYEIADYLLRHGADPAVRDNNGLTPWHKAISIHNQRLTELLASYMTEEQMTPTNTVRVYFDLDAPLAETVSVVSDFNEWVSDRAPMTKREDDGWWYVEVDLFPGMYGYKFDIGSSWIRDPLNTNRYPDSNLDDDNSLFHTSDRLVHMRPERPVSEANKLVPVYFVYEDANAESVSVAGEFNGWNTWSHQMKKQGNGAWYLSLRLAPGEYMYKFVVDRQWILDPRNKLTQYDGEVRNSLLKVEASMVEGE